MTKHQLGDAEIEARFREEMNDIADMLDRRFNGAAKGKDRGVGFLVMVFPFGHEGQCNYVTNAEREEVLELLKEQVRRFEAQPAGRA